MKKNFVRHTLEADNEMQVDALIDEAAKGTVQLAILLLIGQMFDAAVGGEDCFITLGLTRPRDALVLTLSQAGTKTYAAGVDIRGLNDAVVSLL